MRERRVDSAKVLGRLNAWALVVVVAACGPPLTQPSPHNVSGRWTSTDRFFALFNIEVVLNQSADGMISGKWSSSVSPPNPKCPPGVTDTATGPVTGSNTVLEVQFALVGAGDFQGQETDTDTIQGSIVTCGIVAPIRFSRAGPVPTG